MIGDFAVADAFHFLSLAGLVAIAGGLNPIPSRTRPLNSPAPMVLSLKTWKSRSLPGLPRTEMPLCDCRHKAAAEIPRRLFAIRCRHAMRNAAARIRRLSFAGARARRGKAQPHPRGAGPARGRESARDP